MPASVDEVNIINERPFFGKLVIVKAVSLPMIEEKDCPTTAFPRHRS